MKKILTIILFLVVLISSIAGGYYISKRDSSPDDSSAVNNPHYCKISYSTAIDPLYFYANPQRPPQTEVDKYLAKYNETFEGGVIEWKGHFWVTQQQRRNQNYFLPVQSMYNWNEANNKSFKYHSLIWHEYGRVGVPNDGYLDWYEALPVEQRRIALKEYIQEVMRRYKGKIQVYDVVNHPIVYSNWDNYMLTGWKEADAIDQFFRWAHEINPEATLILNEDSILGDNNSQAFYNLARLLKQKGTPIDAIGSQTHLSFTSDYAPDFVKIKNDLDALASLGYRIHITELDLGYPLGDFDVNQPYRGFNNWWDYQADIYKKAFDLFANHKAVDSIILWGFHDGDIWRPGAGIFTGGYSPKPAYNAIKKYLNKEGCVKPPTNPPLTISNYCDNDVPAININWDFKSGGGRSNIFVSIDTDNKFQDSNNGFWRKQLNSGVRSTRLPNGTNPVNPQTKTLVLNVGTKYYVRVHDVSSNYTYPTVSIIAQSCRPVPEGDIEYSIVPTCVDSVSKARILFRNNNFNAESLIGKNILIDTDNKLDAGTDGYWSRQITENTKVIMIPNGFRGVRPKSGGLDLTPGTVYYVKLVDSFGGKVFPLETFTATSCR